jgi:polysaccharide deacetylase family protein (PEP-CTERM system associated)
MVKINPDSVNILTLDIEDWSQSMADVFGPDAAPRLIPTAKVVANTHHLLEILSRHHSQATCFVSGSVADAFPELVREIHDAGHELASHGYLHTPLYRMDVQEFKADVERSMESLSQITGTRVRGYRAPYFSITNDVAWALPVLAELGLEYDASILPVHRRYYRFPGWGGAEDRRRTPHTLIFDQHKLVEIPATTIRVLRSNLPAAGGSFLRFLPFVAIDWLVRSINQSGHPAVFYLHPHDDSFHLSQ